jgi:hypothetical protein
MKLNLGVCMFNRIFSSPVFVPVLSFAIVVALMLLQGRFGDTSQCRIYFFKTVAGFLMIWLVRPRVKEICWKFSWEAALVGVRISVA